MTAQRIEAIDGSGRVFVRDHEDHPDAVFLIEPPLPLPKRRKRQGKRASDPRGYFARRYREYRRREEGV